MTAGALVFLFFGRIIPTGQLGFAAIASLFVAAAVIDAGTAWGLAVWIAAAALGLIIAPDSSASWMFALFFGVYPIIKLFSEKRFPKLGAWIAKLLIFYLGLFSALFIVGVIAGYTDKYGSWIIPVALIAGGVIFVVFDIGYARLIEYYKLRISRKR